MHVNDVDLGYTKLVQEGFVMCIYDYINNIIYIH